MESYDYNRNQMWREVTQRWGVAKKDRKWTDGGFALRSGMKSLTLEEQRKRSAKGAR